MVNQGICGAHFHVNAIDIQWTAIRCRDDYLYQQNLIMVWKYIMFVLDVRLENFNDDEGKGINPGNCYFHSYIFCMYQR
jgi:hypothetical protein